VRQLCACVLYDADFFFWGGGSASVGSGFLNLSKYYKESLSIDCDTKIPSHYMVQCTVE
jgi:hypothetical protein